MVFILPDALPPGRFLSRGPVQVWVSEKFPDDIVPLWTGSLDEFTSAGLVPLLYPVDRLAEPLDLERLDTAGLEDELAADFVAYRRARLPFWTNPTPVPFPAEFADELEPWPHDPGPPFEQWPGPAPATPVTPADPTPGEAAARTLSWLMAEYRGGIRDCRLVLVPAARPSDALALLGWSAPAPLPLFFALLRSWEDRFGARVVAADRELRISVARPPTERAQADQLALEHVLSTADNIVDDPPTPFPEYAADLVGRTTWSLWWD